MSGCKHCPYGFNKLVDQIRKKQNQNHDVSEEILGNTNKLPPSALYDATINHAPKRKEILTDERKKFSLRICIALF